MPTALASAVLVAAGATGKLLRLWRKATGTGPWPSSADLVAAAGTGWRPDHHRERGGRARCAGRRPDHPPARRAQAPSGWRWTPTSLDITPVDSLDLTRQLGRGDSARDLAVPADRQLPAWTTGTVANLAAVVLGAEAIGIAGWAVHTAAEYAKLRHQFGRPIGQFQAVKHRCARMLVAAEQAAAVVWDAAQGARCGDGRTAPFAAAAAAVLATDAAVSCVHECIQVLGGIGYTWEHEAHLYYRRAMTLRALLGAAVPDDDSELAAAAGGTGDERRAPAGPA